MFGAINGGAVAGSYGHIVLRRRDECAVDRRADDIRVGRENGSGRPRDFAGYRSGLFRKRRLGAGTNTLGTQRQRRLWSNVAPSPIMLANQRASLVCPT